LRDRALATTSEVHPRMEIRRLNPVLAAGVWVLLMLSLSPSRFAGAVIAPFYSHYTQFDLGRRGTFPIPTAGGTLWPTSATCCSPGGTANQSCGLFYAVPITRGASGHITGLGSPANPRNPALCCRSRPVSRWWFAASGGGSADGPNFGPAGVYSPGSSC
jgi:hypothetical protein